MHIWIDGQCLQTASNVRGIGRYVSELLSAMNARGDVKLTVSLNANMKEQCVAARTYLVETLPQVDVRIWHGIASGGETAYGYTPQRISDDRILAAHVNNIAPDIALCPSPFEGFDDRSSPFVFLDDVRCKTACIFHDAIPHRFPERYFHHPNISPAYYRRFYSLGRYDYVLCNSEFTLQEYRELFDKDNCVSIGAGLSAVFKELIDSQLSSVTIRKPLHDYLLYVGGLDWRKNVPMMVEALALTPEFQARGMQFVLAGDHSEPELAPIRALWRKYELPEDSLATTGWVSDAQLVKLYRHALVAVQPSLMEGFGLAALEAMASSCAFIAARGGAVGEVVGRDDLLFDGHDPENLAALISRIINDDAFREDAIGFGLKRADEFSWQSSADVAVRNMRTVVTDGPPRPIQLNLHPPKKSPPPRLIMDVTSTAQSPLLSGIQRVIHRLSSALIDTQLPATAEIVLAYADDPSGWYRMDRLDKAAISRDPLAQLAHEANDVHLLIDSSWGYTEAQAQRLVNAMAMGQAVIHGVHDLGPLTKPGMTVESMPHVFRRWLEFILGHSTGIICVSRTVADELYALAETIQLPRPMNIGYIRLGADFNDSLSEPEWLDFIDGRPTFIMVGTIEPRKGHAVVVEAFEQLWARGEEVNLLLIGKPGWNTRILSEKLKHHPQAERRLFLRQQVSDGQLRAAYEQATALIMASYLEGFGLPVVEAGHFGCPVILSDLPVLREVGQGAPLARYFPAGDAVALSKVIEEMASAGHRNFSKVDFGWPNWAGTAQEVRDIIFGGNWYRRYQPVNIAPNAVPAAIGDVRMTTSLTSTERAHHLRWIEGPMISQDGDRIQFTVGIRNDSTRLWSSNGLPGKGLEVNVGSHIIGVDGTILDYENPRSPIPFILAPAEELFIPIYVSTEWLARGAKHVDVEVVQEAVAWFGVPLRLDLAQPPITVDPTHQLGDLADLTPILLREPFPVAGQSGKFVVFGFINSGHGLVIIDEADDSRLQVTMRNDLDQPIEQCRIVNCFENVAPGGYGLMTIHLSTEAFILSDSLGIRLGCDMVTDWRLDLVTRKFRKQSTSPG